MFDPQRYDRQTRFAELGSVGQERLSSARAVVCGCGALGSVLADTLVRAGVGFVRLIDRDRVELSNLPRQTLYNEQDAAQSRPKAEAATEKLAQINSSVELEPIVTEINAENVEQLCGGVDVIVDGTDNFPTRRLMNRASVKLGIPWVFGGCVGASGQVLAILPGKTPCLECLLAGYPDFNIAATPTTAEFGVIGPIVRVVAAIEATEAIKILVGATDAVSRQMTVVDLWENRFSTINVSRLREKVDCPVCGARRRQKNGLCRSHE